MKDPVIVQFDHDENYATVFDLICFNLGVDSGKYFKNIKEAKSYLDILQKEKDYPDIAVIASYLGRDINDGELLAKKIREISPKTKIIAYTEDDEAKWGDYIAMKSGDDKDGNMVEILSKLTGKEFKFDNAK